VINTHYHADHSGGNPKLQGLAAQVITSQQARDKMVEIKQPGMANVTSTTACASSWRQARRGLSLRPRPHRRRHRRLVPGSPGAVGGDMFTFGDATPQLIDYAGGGSARDWTGTLDGALKLEFDQVVPGHGLVTTKQEMRKFRDSTVTLRTKVHDMIVGKKTKAEIEKMLRTDFKFADLHIERSLDGLMLELQ
jgi:glyoxylase-like metal-dependent hydrolase (beta-lactamase superfamily II)